MSIRHKLDDPPLRIRNKQKPKSEFSPLPAKGKQKMKNETSYTNSSRCYVSDEGKSIRGCINTRANLPMKDCDLAAEQAYHGYENVTTGHQNSYAEIRCSVCHNMSNPSLLLQCDLCDSCSHTYCVGLGDTVPEANRICKNCTEHVEDDQDLKAVGLSSIDTHSGSQNRWENHQNVSSTESYVPILDIVRESGSGSYNVDGSLSNQSRPPSAIAGDVRTVLSCRNGYSRIRAFRENWDEIRQESLSFYSFPIVKPGELSSGTSSAMKSSSSNSTPDHATQDTERAWNMMNAAKSLEKKKYTNTIHCSSNASKHPLTNTKTPKHFPSVRSMFLSSGHSGQKDQDCKNLKRPFQGCATEKSNDKRKFRMFPKENPSTIQNFENHPITYSTESSKFSTKADLFSVHGKIDDESSVNLPQNKSLGSFSNNANRSHSSSTCSGTVRPIAKPLAAAKQNVHATAHFNIDEVGNMEKHEVDGQAKVHTDAKGEIQTLVKLNLKLLDTQKKLDEPLKKLVENVTSEMLVDQCKNGHRASLQSVETCPNFSNHLPCFSMC